MSIRNQGLQKRKIVLLGRLLLSFIICVLGFPQSEARASGAPSNLEVVLAIDVSASMRPAIDSTRQAAAQFIGSMPAEVSIGLVTFGDAVRVLTPPTTDRALLAELIDGISLEEDTALFDAVVVAAQQFSPTVPERVIVLLSDGKDEGSSAPLDYAMASLQGIRVEAISLTTSQTDLDSLSSLGAVTSADDAAGMAAAFERISSLLAEVVVVAPTTVAAPSTTMSPPTTTPPATSAASTVPAPQRSTPATLPAITSATTTPQRGPSSMSLVAGGLAVFVGLFLLVVLAFPQPRVSKARLGIKTDRSVSELGRRTTEAVEAALERRGSRLQFATTLAVAKIDMQPGEFIGLVGAGAIVLGLVGLVAGGAVGGLAAAAVVCLVARLYVDHRTARRRTAFADQLPEVLQLITTALRSGFGLAQALEVVAEEAQEPARSEFSQVLAEGRLGRDFPGAMRSLAQRMRSEDLEWVVAAIDINRDIGGNLSEVLTAVSTTIRERQRMVRQVATYTAEGRLSGRVLTVIPIVMALWQWRVNPENFERLFSGGGLIALVIAGLLLVLGSVWIRRIVNSISV